MKPEYPPLLKLGFHPTTVADLRKMCVDAFPLSAKRPVIMDNLEKIIDDLSMHKIEGEVWVDGSFLTEKIEPEDSDILLYVSGEFYDNSTPEQRNQVDFVSSNLKTQFMCDSYLYLTIHKVINGIMIWSGLRLIGLDNLVLLEKMSRKE